MNVRKYTVVYGNFFCVGSNHNSIPTWIRIECKGRETITKVLKKHNIFPEAVQFVLEGHCYTIDNWQ